MATDVRLDDDPTESWVTVDGRVLNITGADLMLNSAERRGTNAGRFRRALVHDQNDGLTINFNGDYSGGVRVNDAVINLKVVGQGGTPVLPKAGNAGDLVLTRNVVSLEGGVVVGETFTMWLCVGMPAQSLSHDGASSWLPISTGEAVVGTG